LVKEFENGLLLRGVEASNGIPRGRWYSTDNIIYKRLSYPCVKKILKFENHQTDEPSCLIENEEFSFNNRYSIVIDSVNQDRRFYYFKTFDPQVKEWIDKVIR